MNLREAKRELSEHGYIVRPILNECYYDSIQYGCGGYVRPEPKREYHYKTDDEYTPEQLAKRQERRRIKAEHDKLRDDFAKKIEAKMSDLGFNESHGVASGALDSLEGRAYTTLKSGVNLTIYFNHDLKPFTFEYGRYDAPDIIELLKADDFDTLKKVVKIIRGKK